MKKTYLLIFLITYLSTITFSQTLTPKLGISISRTSYNGTTWTKMNSQQGFVDGLGFEFPILNNRAAFYVEALYVGKGQGYTYYYENNSSIEKSKATIANNYIVITPML